MVIAVLEKTSSSPPTGVKVTPAVILKNPPSYAQRGKKKEASLRRTIKKKRSSL